jgi:hypothetical protein
VTYKLFIDDERAPADSEFVTARSSAEAIDILATRGMPMEIAFDHDLGGEDTAMHVVRWLADQVMDGALEFPRAFTYSVHSQNPIGAGNVRGLLDALLQHFPPA